MSQGTLTIFFLKIPVFTALLFSFLIPRSKQNLRRKKPIPQNVEVAAEKVLRNEMALREAAREYEIYRSTLKKQAKQ